jgi:diguanylate cyclase (GGDEF)-like protein
VRVPYPGGAVRGIGIDAGGVVGVVALASPLAGLFWLPTQSAVTAAAIVRAATLVVGCLVLTRAARAGDQTLSRSRRLLAISTGLAAFGSAYTAGQIIATGAVSRPSLADVAVLAALPLAVLAFCQVPWAATKVTRGRTWLDGVIAWSSLFFVAWLLVLAPLFRGPHVRPPAEVLHVAYIVAMTGLASFALVVSRYAHRSAATMLVRATGGIVLLGAGQIAEGRMWITAHRARFGLPDLVVEAGILLLVYSAAASGHRRRRTPSSRSRTVDLPTLTAALPVLIGFPYVALGHPLTVADVSPAAVMIIALLARQRLDAGELRAAARSHERAASVDDLTGLATRRSFLAQLNEHVAREGGAVAVVLIDLDGFKEVNDRYGHHTGDEVLVGFARVLQSAASGHVVARLGGDEFAVACFSADAAVQACRVTSKLADVQAIDTSDSGVLAVGCSAGVALTQAADVSAGDVMRRADLAMYAAKSSPAVRVVAFEPELEEAASRKHLLIAALAGAAERGELHLAYQPLRDLATGELVGIEALLRWAHPTLGLVPPDEFIPLAEETGHIGAVGRWVLATAIATVADWHRAGLAVPRVLVNVSAQQFAEPDFDATVHGLLAAHGLEPALLTLEVTETQLAGLAVTDVLHQLRSSGIELAIDDFGTGYSNLARLSRLPVNILKIDREFIAGVGHSSGREVLRAVIALARSLDLTIVAEGIETQQQHLIARACGIGWGQGYLFAAPLSVEAMTAVLLDATADTSDRGAGGVARPRGGQHDELSQQTRSN